MKEQIMYICKLGVQNVWNFSYIIDIPLSFNKKQNKKKKNKKTKKKQKKRNISHSNYPYYSKNYCP